MSSVFYENYDSSGKRIITTNRKNLLSSLSEESLQNIIISILCGGNLRELTETTTKNRLILSNAALLNLFVVQPNQTTNIKKVLEAMKNTKKSSNEYSLLLWLLGLTKKGLDNIVRNSNNLEDYSEDLEDTYNSTIQFLNKNYGPISGCISIKDHKTTLNWNLIVRLFIALGSQTLTIRGSDKSMNGKVFERLILGALLSILGFKYYSEVPDKIEKSEKLFWLSSTDEADRETDATVVYNGNAVTIDLGFIGRGNPEISLDKATRFLNNKVYGRIEHVVSTIIIVDTIGKNSTIFDIAKKTNSALIQMNDPKWVREFAIELDKRLKFSHPNFGQTTNELHNFIETKVTTLTLLDFLK